ncbi:MAG: type II toxin-antitoxin system VapC family toxin [Deltaproteobacteria bacterium]|nr:type II toxin-antitoxin system VapC family toxin [Deltaproteobacteria bacterium]
MIGVVDTSALLRLFVPDGPLPNGFKEFLTGVERGVNVAIAPELLLAEAANALNKKRKSDLLTVPIRLFPHRPILMRALELAEDNGLTVYDNLYLALAEEHGGVIYSADRKLIKAASRLGLMA